MKAKRIKKKTVQFGVLVDEALFDAANKLRKKTWVELTEQMLRAMVDAEKDERLVGWGAGGKEPLRPIYREKKSK